jgi:hypothetical protein
MSTDFEPGMSRLWNSLNLEAIIAEISGSRRSGSWKCLKGIVMSTS